MTEANIEDIFLSANISLAGYVNKPVSRVINSSFLARIQIWNS